MTPNIFLVQNSENSEMKIKAWCMWYFLKHLNIQWFSWVLPFLSFFRQYSCLLSPFTFFVLHLVTLMYWFFFVIIIKKHRVSLYPRLSHLSLLHLVIWTHFYFMYWFFKFQAAEQLMNSCPFSAKGFFTFLPMFLLSFCSNWKNLPPPHHILVS